MLKLEEEMNKCYALKILGDAHYYLGTTIICDQKKGIISLGQTSYIDKAITCLGLENATPAPTPLVPSIQLGRDLCPTDA
jgi:hypothetical protein